MAVQPVATTQLQDRPVEYLVQLLAGRALDAKTISPGEERALLAWCKWRRAKYLGRIETHIQRGAMRPARREADRMRKSLAARLLSLSATLPKSLRISVEPQQRDLARIQRLTAILNNVGAVGAFNRPVEAKLRLKRKKTFAARTASASSLSSYRPIFSFDWLDKADLHLLSVSYMPFANFHASQYLLRRGTGGRGRSAVCEDLQRLLPQLPTDHVFMQFDVRNFYGSVSHTWLEENLGFSQAITRRYVHTGGMSVSPMASAMARLNDGELKELVRRGIPGGSALSPLIGECVMADILRGLADHLSGVVPMTYCDNIGVILPRERADVLEEQLRGAFRNHGAGPFELTSTRPRSITQGFRFLGYWWRVQNGEAQIHVPPEVAECRMLVLAEELGRAGSKELAALRRGVRSQVAEWRYWPGVGEWRHQALELIASVEGASSLDNSRGRIVPVAHQMSMRDRGNHFSLQS